MPDLTRLAQEITTRLGTGFDHTCALVRDEDREDGTPRTDLYVLDLDVPRHDTVDDLIEMMLDLEDLGMVGDCLVLPYDTSLDAETRAYILDSAAVVFNPARRTA